MHVVIHGANSGKVEIEPLRAALGEHFQAVAIDWVGHGGRPVPADLTVAGLARDIVESMDAQGIARAWLTGYSVGGYVALYVARHYPDRVAGVLALATKVAFDPKTVAHWSYLAAVERLAPLPRAKQLARTHAPNDWRDVARLNQRFFQSLLAAPALDAQALRAIACPVMLANGNRDQLVPIEETHEIAKLIPRSTVHTFWGVAHPIQAVPVKTVARELRGWISTLGA